MNESHATHAVYLIMKDGGEIYLGASSRLLGRFLDHNRPNKHKTNGHRWYLLAVARLPTRIEAFALEKWLHSNPGQKYAWRDYAAHRAATLAKRHTLTIPWLNYKKRTAPKPPPTFLQKTDHNP